MATSKRFIRPKAVPEETKVADEAAISALINRGGSVATSKAEDGEEVKRVQLRLPIAAQDRIDAVRKLRPVRPSRHAWILEAIYEKLEREES